MKKRHSEEQIIRILKQAEADALCGVKRYDRSPTPAFHFTIRLFLEFIEYAGKTGMPVRVQTGSISACPAG